MSETPPPAALTFDEASRHVVRRLWLRKSLLSLRHTLPYALAVLLLLAVLRALGATGSGAGLALTGMMLWAAGCFSWTWWRRPGPYASLAFWDQQTGRGDAFANAWWFERAPNRSPGQEFHRRAQSALLPAALASLGRDIGLPDARSLAAAPVLIAALLFIPGGQGVRLPDVKLTDEGKRLAAQEGSKLAEKRLDADKMKALTEAEKKELEKLRQQVADTAKALQQQEQKTSREVLSELEKRARDAERLAEKLGAGSDAWASEQMVAEMRRHADTAELGDAVANKSTGNTAKEAQKLADQLRDPKLTHEVRDRVSEMLKNIGKQAQPGDSGRTVGQHVLNADKDMAQTLPKEAGDEFQKLADKMRTLAAREKAREQLEKLAEQLRDAGSKVAGQGTQGMQQLAGSQGQAGQEGQGSQGQQPMMNLQNAPQMQPMPMPGLSGAPQGQGQQGTGQNMPLYTPVPGTGKPDPKLALTPGVPGGKGNNNAPVLIAPIPGTNPGQQPDMAILGMMSGGTQAGKATTDLDNKPTEKSKPGQQATVNTQRNAEGESAVRAVEGRGRQETAARTPQATALEAIAAEENALDDAALPAARREQVRRYFTELRKRFEKEN